MTKVARTATMRNAAFWVCLTLSIGLLVTGFFIPPTGEIDGSVLKAVGELFGFATLEVVFHSIRSGRDTRIKHGNTEVTVGDLNDREEAQ